MAYKPEFVRGISCAVLVLGTAIGVAGCSDDSTRFNYPMLGMGDPNTVDYSTTSSIPPQGGFQQGSYNAPAPQRTAAYTPSQTRYYGSQTSAPAPSASYASGPRVTVQQGDTLSSLSQRYGVSIGTIQSANNLADARLRPGQVLVMPGANMAGATRTASSTPVAPVAQPAPVAPPAAPVDQASAQTSNGPAVPAMPAMPATRKVSTTTISAPADGAAAQSAPAASGTSVTSNGQLPTPDPLSGNSFRWPVKGRIISGFGTKPDGGHNDGVDISVPQGTPVKAAENGVVAYSGSELKGYGNLVLVRHANNWVSAYANNEQLLVKRGDKVSRGQVIAKAGTSGSVSQPQVHFELRKGSRPVDPTQYMSSMAAQAD
ncbi:M23 family metallopeptidase [Methyloceanibacter caenitepidi]|uniref:M23 family metallopeptidase n=1 Tax=Methyloceanibacter caenitepidi TaxID=1384459 RepID=UPI00155A34D8|nr:M23 family metallopeptidase [Methyloceanibacter caenitepidi]